MKSILILNWRDTRHVFAGGAEKYLHEMGKRWVLKGYRVTMFCGNDGRCAERESIDGIQIFRKGGTYTVYLWAIWYYYKYFRGKYDVILDCENGIPFFSPVYARKIKIFCVVFHVHQGVFRKYLWLPMAWLASFLEKDLMPYVYRKKKFVTISESTRMEMLAHGFTDTVEIVYPGTETHEIALYAKSEIPTILYLGRLKAYKSVDVLIRAYEKFREKYVSNSRLIIAGSGEEEVFLKELVNNLGLNDSVQFLGFVDEIHKVKLMSEAWVFVNPSMMEGWGLTVIDANACGTVVVASDVPGLRESVKHLETGILFRYGDEKMLSDVMHNLVISKEDRLQYEINARSWAEKFNWNVMADKFLKILEN